MFVEKKSRKTSREMIRKEYLSSIPVYFVLNKFIIALCIEQESSQISFNMKSILFYVFIFALVGGESKTYFVNLQLLLTVPLATILFIFSQFNLNSSKSASLRHLRLEILLYNATLILECIHFSSSFFSYFFFCLCKTV